MTDWIRIDTGCVHDYCYDALQPPTGLVAWAGRRTYPKVWRECCKCHGQVLRARLQ